MRDPDDPITALLDDPQFGRRYALVKKLGQGGMGAVYAMEDRELRRRVAVKIAIGADADDRARFAREGRLLAQLSHPHILKVFSADVVGQTPVLVTELLDGWTLDTEMPAQPTADLASVLQTTEMVLEGLEAAHRAGIIHRDLKPQNILRLAGGSLKLLDFGLAKRPARRPAGAPSVTQAGMIVGTPEYMSPEQCRGDELDARSDIYQVGVILFQLVSGRLPFRADSPLELILLHIRERPPELDQVAPRVPPALSALVRTALSKSPADRFASAAQMMAAVRDVARKLHAPAAAIARTIPVPAPTARTPRTLPSRGAALALVISTALLVLAYALSPRPSYPPEPIRVVRSSPPVARELPPPVTLHPAFKIVQRHALLDERIAALRCSTDGARVLIVTETGQVHTWAIQSQKLAEAGVLPEIGRALAVSPDLESIAVAGRSGVTSYTTGSSRAWTASARFQAGPVDRLAFSPDGSSLATARARGSVDLWRVADGQHRRSLPEIASEVRHLEFLADGRLAALLQTPELLIWDVSHSAAPQSTPFTALLPGPEVKSPEQWDSVTSLAISPDGRTLAALDGRNALHIVPFTGSHDTWQHEIRAISPLSKLAFAADGKHLAMLGTHDLAVQIQDVPFTGVNRESTDGALSQTVDLRFSATGDRLASSFADHRLTIWQLPELTPRPVLTQLGTAVLFFPISKNLDFAMMGGFENNLQFWRLSDRAEFPGPEPSLLSQAQRASLSPDGFSAVIDWKTELGPSFSVVDIRTASVLCRPTRLGGRNIDQLALSTSGRLAALAPVTRDVQLWTLAPRATSLSLPAGPDHEIRCLAFTPDDKHLVEIRHEEPLITLWTLPPAKIDKDRLDAGKHDIVSCLVSPDSALLATGESDGRVRVWDLTSHRLRFECAGARRWIRALAFTPDSKLLAAGGTDTKIYVWNLKQ